MDDGIGNGLCGWLEGRGIEDAARMRESKWALTVANGNPTEERRPDLMKGLFGEKRQQQGVKGRSVLAVVEGGDCLVALMAVMMERRVTKSKVKQKRAVASVIYVQPGLL